MALSPPSPSYAPSPLILVHVTPERLALGRKAFESRIFILQASPLNFNLIPLPVKRSARKRILSLTD